MHWASEPGVPRAHKRTTQVLTHRGGNEPGKSLALRTASRKKLVTKKERKKEKQKEKKKRTTDYYIT